MRRPRRRLCVASDAHARARLDTPHADPSRSAADAWIFASLSLDGKVVVNHVPPSEKYKILL